MLTRGEDGYFAVSRLVGLLKELLRACALEIERRAVVTTSLAMPSSVTTCGYKSDVLRKILKC